MPVELRRIEDLRPRRENARTHSDRQIAKLAASIRAFGFTAPILVDEVGNVLAGHGRLAAAKRLGLERVPTLRIGGLSETQKRAYQIADNRLAELAGWDRSILADELTALTEIEFDVELTGFDTGEIDLMIDGPTDSDGTVPSESVALPDRRVQPTSREGDLWTLGEHFLLCGDARDASAYRLLLGTSKAEMVFTDPPYNVPIEGHVCGSGAVHHREFAMASGEMSETEYEAFLDTTLLMLRAFSTDGSIHYVCMDWRHVDQLIHVGKRHFAELKNICVWVKTNAGMGTFYRSQHELIAVFKNGTARHINNFGLGAQGRYRTNVWRYPGVNTFRHGRAADLEAHPTCKPTALVADAIRDCSKRQRIILDPFGGSGTTILAAERTGRRARVIEIDPAFVDVAIRRWEEATGGQAILTPLGRCFAEVEAERRPSGGNG